MRRAADTANGRELRIKAKLQEVRAFPSFGGIPSADSPAAQVHDAYKKVRALLRCRHLLRATLRARFLTLRCAVARAAQAKNKSLQLQEAVTAASNDRDELQKKYEAKSRCVAQLPARIRCKRLKLNARLRSEKRQMEDQLNSLHSENQVRCRARDSSRALL